MCLLDDGLLAERRLQKRGESKRSEQLLVTWVSFLNALLHLEIIEGRSRQNLLLNCVTGCHSLRKVIENQVALPTVM